VVTVTDEEIVAAMVLAFERMKVVLRRGPRVPLRPVRGIDRAYPTSTMPLPSGGPWKPPADGGADLGSPDHPGHPGRGGGIDGDLPAAPTPQWTVLEAGEAVGERHRTRDR
jgi:hypothetical protein